MSQGTEKCEYWARNQCPAWIGLLGMPGKTVGGDDERWHRAWMDAQCNNAMWGQTVSLPVGRHLNPALTEHTCTLTHICHRKSLSNRCWSSQNLFPPCMSHEFFNVPPFLRKKKASFSSFAPVGCNGSNKGQWWERVSSIWGVCM